MKGSIELEKEIHKLIRFGLDEKSIVRSLKNKVPDPILLEEAAERICESYPDYDFIQFFMKSKVVVDKDGFDDFLYLYNSVAQEVRTIDKSRLSAMISPKLDWNYKRHTCVFTYNPFIPFKLRKHEKQWQFNLYEPPTWAVDYFQSGGDVEIERLDIIPTMYDRFIYHLVNEDRDSYNYILDWMANMIQARNYCILTTIGNQGIGKGVLGEIMLKLVGESNYAKTDKKLINKDFNGQIKHKRLIYLDEVKVNNTDQENRLKNLVNDYLEIEQKGRDAKLDRNYSSIYYSSNNMDAIKIPADDRRFSIVNLTETKLISIMQKQQIADLLKKENIEKFARYLMTRKVDKNAMMQVFRSDRTELVRSSSLNAWQEWFIEELVADKSGSTLLLNDVGELIEDKYGARCRPGRKALKSLEGFYPDLFKVKKGKDKHNSSKQAWFVEFF